MGRIGVTYEQYQEAANQVLMTGQFPTIEKVRLVLGVGSNTTLNTYTNRWKDEFIKNHLAGTKATELPDPVQRMIIQVWETLRDESSAQNQQIQKEAEQTVDQALLEKNAAEEKTVVLQEHVDKLILQNSHLQADLQLRQEKYNEEKKEHETWETRALAGEESQRKFEADTQERFIELKQSHEEAINQFKQQITLIEKNHQREVSDFKDQIENQRQRMIVEIDQLKVSKDKAEKSLAKTESDLKFQTDLRKTTEEQARSLSIELKVAQQEKWELEMSQQIHETQIKELRQQLKEFKEDFVKQLQLIKKKLILF